MYMRASAKSQALGMRPLPSKMVGPVTVIVLKRLSSECSTVFGVKAVKLVFLGRTSGP